MKDYRQIVNTSRFADFSGLSEDDKNDYRSSFLMGMDILLSRVDKGILRIGQKNYQDMMMVPSILLNDGDVCDSTIQIQKNDIPGQEDQPEQDRLCSYAIVICQNQKVRSIKEVDLTVEEAFAMFAFIYSILDDGEYEDIDEFYGYELS